MKASPGFSTAFSKGNCVGDALRNGLANSVGRAEPDMEEKMIRRKSEQASSTMLVPKLENPDLRLRYPMLLRFILAMAIVFCPLTDRAAGQSSLKLGATFAANSTIGKVVSLSLQLALQDVNANTSILPNHTLQLDVVDSSCGAFQGAAAVVELLKRDVAAVMGPQISVIAQFSAELGAATNVPVVSFAATDPMLTANGKNPYFLRTVHDDALEMKTLARLVGLYGWKEVSIITTSDSVGLISLEALLDALSLLGVTIDSNRTASIPSDISSEELVSVLKSVQMQEARVVIVHLQFSLGRLLFQNAESLGMMTTGYVWLVSEAMSSLLDTLPTSDPIWSSVQGVLAVRSYIPPSQQLQSFQSRWTSHQSGSSAVGLNIYGIYAYDTLWMIARSMDTFLRLGKNFTFAPRPSLPTSSGGDTDLAKLSILVDGESFLQTMHSSSFVGLSGLVEFDADGDIVGSTYEILNVFGKSSRVVGYWNEDQGFSPSYNRGNGSTPLFSEVGNSTLIPQQLQDVIWPGGSAQVPKGWAVVKNGQKLLIGVPWKTGFKEFVNIQNVSNMTIFHGLCIDVFEAAVGYLPYGLNYSYVAYGNGIVNPNYDDLVQAVADNTFDAVVGDVTITTERAKIVDFTESYISSGLVVLVPTKTGDSGQPWAFLRPFTPLMWFTTLVFFLFTGLTVWILEHKRNEEFRGLPKKQIITMFWFIFSTLFFSQQEQTRSTLGRVALIVWLFVVLIIISSYTASLTSILTVQQLTPTLQGIGGLIASKLKIGIQVGTYVESYLPEIGVQQSRLVPLENEASYAFALSKGTVGAIVDEIPYIQDFLSKECGFAIAGQEFTRGGWGFPFPKGSQLAADMSSAILQMAEDGSLQQIQEGWLSGQSCDDSSGSSVDSSESALGVRTFWGLFLITGVVSICCIVVYFTCLLWQHHKVYVNEESDSNPIMSRSSRGRSFLRSLAAFIDESEIGRERPVNSTNSRTSTLKNSTRNRRSMDPEAQDRETEPPDGNAGITSQS